MTLNTISVTGTFQNASLTGATGSVSFTPSSVIVDSSGSLILTQTAITTQVTAGTMTPVSLVTTDNTGLSPSNWNYLVSIAVPGAVQTYSTYITHTGSTVDISTLTQAVAPATPTGLYVQSINGYAGQITISVVNGQIVIGQGE